MSGYIRVQKHLLLAAQQIAAACRLIINRPRRNDNDLLKGT